MIRDIYSNPQLYDAAHWWKTNDINFITNAANEFGSPVLELAAGTGRLAIPILENGLKYTGVELSPDFVKCAKMKLIPFGKSATIIKGDIRNFNLGKQFPFIFIGFNSVLHLTTNDDISSFFHSVYNHLSDDGTFLIDVFIPHPIFLYRSEKKYYVMEFDDADGRHCIVSEKNEYDSETQINHIHWFFNYDGQEEAEEFAFDMHMIYPDTMDRLLTDAGFFIREKYGDYDKTPLNSESHLQIYLCGK